MNLYHILSILEWFSGCKSLNVAVTENNVINNVIDVLFSHH